MANIIQKLSYIKENFPAYIKRYIYPFPKFKKEFIVMIDGTQSHGGLTDRFRNILSVYLFCKNNKLKFRLYYIYPCNLKYYLLPHRYNWTIESKNISYSIYDTRDLYIYIQMPIH